jgi:hypothetical protein
LTCKHSHNHQLLILRRLWAEPRHSPPARANDMLSVPKVLFAQPFPDGGRLRPYSILHDPVVPSRVFGSLCSSKGIMPFC